MNDNIVKLVFKTVMAGSGFEKMNAQTSELMKRMSKMSQGVTIVGNAFGNLGGVVGRSLSMLMQGGIWGAAAAVATTTFGKAVEIFQKWKAAADDALLSARGLSREFMTLEKLQSGYMKRVESYAKKREAADKAENEAAEKKKKAIDAYRESQKKAEEFAVAYAAAEEKIAQESMKAGLNSDKEIVRLRTKVKLMLEVAKANVRAAEEQVRLKAKHGDESGMTLAKKDLDLALVQQKNAVSEARKLVAEYKKAKDLKKEEAEQQMLETVREEAREKEQAEKRRRLEKADGEVRKKYAEAVKRIEDEIAEKKKEAARLEENAKRARGVGFGDWERGERELSKKDRIEASNQAKREKAVDDEIARLEKTNPKTRTKWQKERLGRLKEWKADQNPANNPAARAVEDLEKKREKLLIDQNNKLDEIAKFLKECVTQ